jgi:outer membrane receptor protein involved in Fe transport
LAYDRVTYPANFRFAPLSPGEQARDQLGPKAGFVLTPTPDTTLRGAYTRSLGGVSFDQSFRIEPSQVAGFNQAFRSIMPEAVVGSVSAEAFETYDLQWEQRLPSRTYLGVSGEMLFSDATPEIGAVQFNLTSGVSSSNPYQPTTTRWALNYEERTLLVYVNQLIGRDTAIGVSYRLSRAQLDSSYPNLPAGTPVAQYFALRQTSEGTLHQLRLYGLLNHPSGFFCGAEGLWNLQENGGYTPPLPGTDFWQANVFAGFRFWRRHAQLQVALLNLTDQDYRLNPLNLMTSELPRARTLTVSLGFFF